MSHAMSQTAALTHTHTCLQTCDKTVTMTFTFDLTALVHVLAYRWPQSRLWLCVLTSVALWDGHVLSMFESPGPCKNAWHMQQLISVKLSNKTHFQ